MSVMCTHLSGLYILDAPAQTFIFNSWNLTCFIAVKSIDQKSQHLLNFNPDSRNQLNCNLNGGN